MRLARLGAAFPTRLSFMRGLVRRMAREGWRFEQTVWNLDEQGYGQAVWRIGMPSGVLSFAAFSTALDPAERTDRVIAEKWDASFVLSDGELTAADVARLAANAPKQEAGRFSPKDLVLSRANKSLRLFDYVVQCLASGRQPAMRELLQVGYLMRTTAVYGNGKFGIGDFPAVREHPELAGPYRAEMLIVYMIRQFSLALVEHIARAELAADRKRALGIGNATGLGMAPFLLRHPILLHHWVAAREQALARLRGVETMPPERLERLRALLARAKQHVEQWNVDDGVQRSRIETLRRELREISAPGEAALSPCNELYLDCERRFSLETQELMVALLIELHPELVDGFEDMMIANDPETIEGTRTTAEVRSLIEQHYGWALATDFTGEEARRYFWYYSENKEEPRLGERFAEAGAEREMQLAMGWYVKHLYASLGELEPAQTIAEFLLKHPEHRLAARRVETAARYPYSEIHDNVIGAGLRPIDLLRGKLAFFGATKFDPKSDRWTRITMYQGAPLIDELARPDADDWWLPAFHS
jgi:hypothetical protein